MEFNNILLIFHETMIFLYVKIENRLCITIQKLKCILQENILLNIDSLINFYSHTIQFLNEKAFKIIILLSILFILIPVLITVALLTLVERKIMSSIQRRRGPNIIGFFGILQPFADGLKLLTKEFNIPARSFDAIVIMTPMISLMFTCSCFSLIPFATSYFFFTTNSISTLYVMAISSLNIYSIIMAGWSSKSAYAFLGSLRASAQFISYEVSLTLNFMGIFIITGSFSLVEISYMQEETIPNVFIVFPILILFVVGVLSETNRTPFDLAEAESELVAGYGVEFSAVGFAFFFIAEYASIILYCILLINLFFSGFILKLENFINFFFEVNNSNIFLQIAYSFFFGILIYLLLICFIYIRATYARYRFDQLMKLNWKNLLVLSLILDLYLALILKIDFWFMIYSINDCNFTYEFILSLYWYFIIFILYRFMDPFIDFKGNNNKFFTRDKSYI
jgi:NADH-quinone oxidoreductase subunit H